MGRVQAGPMTAGMGLGGLRPDPLFSTLVRARLLLTSIMPARETNSKSTTSLPYRRLMKEEMRAKNEKELCFKCDSKFSFGHRCKKKELQFMFVQDGEDMTDDNEDEANLEKKEVEGDLEPEKSTIEMVNLSLNSIGGFSSPKTVKMKGMIKGCEIDYQLLVMNFCVGNWMGEQRRDRSLVHSRVSLQSMMKAFTVEDQGLVVELSVMEPEAKTKEDGAFYKAVDALPPSIQMLVQRYEGVSMTPTQLPSERIHDHSIELQPKRGLVNVHP